MPDNWLPDTIMDKDIIRYKRAELLRYLKEEGVHLHLHPGSQAFWRATYSLTKVCSTQRCFRLKIKRLRLDT